MIKRASFFTSEHDKYISSVDVQLFTQMVDQENLSPASILAFKQHIQFYFKQFGRTFSWRQTNDPYQIVVSEIMLQQTQTHRVQKKFEQFIEQFPTFEALAHAQIREVITVWQGLGYNRRALALHVLAQRVIQEFNGVLPDDFETLKTFKGIGPNTAGSVCAFAFNRAVIFIETNIRSVFLHFFFREQSDVHDKVILPLIRMTLDEKNPRDWYYALMDYGVALKKIYANPSRKSMHHTRQSRFEGSDRQLRGKILHLLVIEEHLEKSTIATKLSCDKQRVFSLIIELEKDGFIRINDDKISLL